MTLRRILADAARGVFPPTDGSASIVPQPSERDAGVISFTGCRLLARAARHLIPDAGPLWAQVAPGNAASVRALLAAGFIPVGAEALLVPEDIRHGPSGQDAGYERYPSGRGAP